MQPVWGMVSSTISFLVADEAPAFSSELSSIYNPDALKQADKPNKESSSAEATNKDESKQIDGKETVELPRGLYLVILNGITHKIVVE